MILNRRRQAMLEHLRAFELHAKPKEVLQSVASWLVLNLISNQLQRKRSRSGPEMCDQPQDPVNHKGEVGGDLVIIPTCSECAYPKQDCKAPKAYPEEFFRMREFDNSEDVMNNIVHLLKGNRSSDGTSTIASCLSSLTPERVYRLGFRIMESHRERPIPLSHFRGEDIRFMQQNSSDPRSDVMDSRARGKSMSPIFFLSTVFLLELHLEGAAKISTPSASGSDEKLPRLAV
uniref:Uncharacterized protein n=1 Tax=Ditylenchus dipsaci TaxID=166011 RepID=A0A915CYR1_9BILA